VDAFLRLPGALRSLVKTGVETLPSSALWGRAGSVQRFAQRAELGLPGAYLSWLSYVSEEDRQLLTLRDDEWAVREYHELWEASYGAGTLHRLLDLNIRTYLLDDLLVKADRMSMAHGLEVRSPFLDIDLLEYVFRLPPASKLRGPFRKRVLKRAMHDLLPHRILHRRKRGFAVPLGRWFRDDLSDYVDAVLFSASTRLYRHVVREQVERLFREHQAGARDHSHALWALLTLEIFLRREGW
jgi:asparagine synthase (glutamine-hydrolysing)